MTLRVKIVLAAGQLHERRDPLARALEQRVRLLRERVDAAVDVRVVVAVVVVERGEHRAPASARSTTESR